MPVTTTTYKGITVIDGIPEGAGGLVLQDADKALADRIGPFHTSVAVPNANNDGVDTAGIGKVFEVNSRWIVTGTGNEEEYVCVDNTTGAAIWLSTTLGDDLVTHEADTTTHGTTGDIVGTSDTQTITNKTISGANNTISNIAQSSVINLTTDLAARELLANKNQPNGYAGLDSNGDLVGTFIVRVADTATMATIVLDEGELGYTSDTKKLYLGDGVTSGGNPVIPAASASVAGTMSSAHFSLVNGATDSPTNDTLVKRSSSGGADLTAVNTTLVRSSRSATQATLQLYGGSSDGSITAALVGVDLQATGSYWNNTDVGVPVRIKATLNQSGTAGYNALLIDVTETTVGTGEKLPINVKVGGVSKFSVNSTGAMIGIGSGLTDIPQSGVINLTSDLALKATLDSPTFTGTVTANRVTANQYSATYQTLTDGTNISWNLDSGATATVTLGGNRILDNPTNIVAGATYIVIVKQDGTGGRTLNYGTAYKFPGGVKPVLTVTANAIDILTFISDGTSLFGVAQKGFA